MTRTTGFIGLCCFGLVLAGCGDDGKRVEVDGGSDGGVAQDAAGSDSGAGTDSGPSDTCAVGYPCRSIGDPCPVGLECLPEFIDGVGGPTDPITDNPGGADTPITWTAYAGGYCTPGGLPRPASDTLACDLNDPGNSCGPCATCVFAGNDASGTPNSLCLRSCTPSWTSNECPVAGQSCPFGRGPHVCVQGCASDEQCKVTRVDTNANGSFDPYDPTDNPTGDRLVYDDSTNATCNPVTYLCDFDPRSGTTPEAGDPCTGDFDCEANGACILWGDDGYCTKIGCGSDGVCAGDGVCHDRELRNFFDFCAVPCSVGAEDGMAHEVGVGGHGDGCEAGLQCEWDGINSTGMNGGCVEGEYNDVADFNTGDPCTEGNTCYSPFGGGFCLSGSFFGNTANNYCSIMDCAASGLPSDVCGPGGQCVQPLTGFNICVKTCTTADECAAGHGCIGWGASAPKGCFPACRVAEDCRTGETCNVPAGASTGQCGAS